MTHAVTRRSLLLTGTLGLGAFAVPGFAQTATVLGKRGFTHGVASGEPGPDSMLLWTRYVGSGDSAALKVEISETPEFTRIAGGGGMTTGAWRDWTTKITVTGLLPGRDYHYRFVAPDGSFSPVGRTKTLPDDAAKQFRAAIFSCSNLAFGWFNAYAHAAARDDLDLAIHLGDYFYEYGPNTYPLAKDAIAARLPIAEPNHEILVLADYRLRYSSYRSDPDLQALHARLPMIAQWDDHEITNDTWEGGAQNHDAATEGDWNARRAAAVQAYREWMPISDEPWKAYDIGRLATLFRTETRTFARSRPTGIGELLKAGGAPALTAFRDGAWQDPAATMMGGTQETWLADAMRASVKAGQRWQVVAFGTIMGHTRTPPEAEGWAAGSNERLRAYVLAAVAAGKAGLPANLDNWGGYPAARTRFLSSAQAAEAELIVIAGDSHNGWAYDLKNGTPAGVEFAGHAVTSSGYEGGISIDPKLVARAMVAANPELKWCDTSRRGYMALTIDEDRVANDWVFLDTVRARTPAASIGHTATVDRGRKVMGV